MYYDSFTAPEIGMPQKELAPLFTAGVPIRYRKGQLIYFQGTAPEYLYCLVEGIVRTYITSDQGAQRLLTTYRAGSVFGEASFFDGMPRVSTAEALSPCRIIRLSRPEVDQLLRNDPELASAMLSYLARTVRLLSGHVDTMSFQSADKRLANLLLNYPAAGGTIRQTHEELAAALGVSRVTVSRILSDFSGRGLIRTGYGTITLLDPAALAAFA